MFCTSCGQEISNEAVVCIHCGVATPKAMQSQYKPIIGFILSIIFPLVVGLIVSIIEYKKAKKVGGDGSLALAGIIISSIFNGIFLIYIISIVFLIVAAVNSHSFLPIFCL